jgi:hypothetical protein
MLRRLASWSLAIALLCMQALGTMHAVAHARGPAVASSQAQDGAKQSIAGLFKGHEDGSSCRLFDQLSHGDAAAPAIATQLAVAPFAVLPQPVIASRSAQASPGGLARAPPVPG